MTFENFKAKIKTLLSIQCLYILAVSTTLDQWYFSSKISLLVLVFKVLNSSSSTTLELTVSLTVSDIFNGECDAMIGTTFNDL